MMAFRAVPSSGAKGVEVDVDSLRFAMTVRRQ
jgi:hypothetical protein